MPYFDILFLVAGVALFARGARVEEESPLVWGGISMAAWIVTFLRGGGFLPWLVGQLVVYGLMFGWGLWKDKRREARK